MTTRIKVPNPVRAKKTGLLWIPPFNPHWDLWMGPYQSKQEILDVCEGLEDTINSPAWQMMLVEMVDEFEEEWIRRFRRRISTNSA